MFYRYFPLRKLYFLFDKFVKFDLEIIHFNQFIFRVQNVYVNILKVDFFFIPVEYFYSNIYIVDSNAFESLFWLIIILSYVDIPTGNTYYTGQKCSTFPICGARDRHNPLTFIVRPYIFLYYAPASLNLRKYIIYTNLYY